MKIFNLPDLGEGLPDAEIHAWHVKVGDVVAADQLMVSMETAKAVVEVPAPQAGKITKLFGNVGDIIKTGKPLVGFDGDEKSSDAPLSPHSQAAVKSCDAATVAGAIEVGNKVLRESAMGVTRSSKNSSATSAVQKLATALNIDIQLLTGTGFNGRVTAQDVITASKNPNIQHSQLSHASDTIAKPLRGVRRAMATVMTQSHHEIVPVTVVDDADLHAWPVKTDITLRVLQAIIAACEIQPELNAWFDTKQMSITQHKTINLGIAMDSIDGLFVPVLRDIANTSSEALRGKIEHFKEQVKQRSIPTDDLKGATIMLSNFGTFAGRYANPVLAPPCVCIIGTGRIREQVVAHEGKMQIHKIMPISITVDHRAITGGEATRFLAAFINDLQRG